MYKLMSVRLAEGRALHLLSVLILSLSLAQISQAAWIHAKAALAQYLIAQSWEEVNNSTPTNADTAMVIHTASELQRNETVQKPWPWADTWPVARLQYTGTAPAQDLFVLAGAQGNSLAFGPGHMYGSALPGTEGVSIVGGHRDTHFAFLQHVSQGDVFTVTPAKGEQQHYIVTAAKVADSLSEPLLAMPYASQMLLVTCYPFDAVTPGHLRYVVTTELIREAAPGLQTANYIQEVSL